MEKVGYYCGRQIPVNLEHFYRKSLQISSMYGDRSSFSNNFSNDDAWSLYAMRRHLSCRRLILLFIVRLWHIQVSGQQLNCEVRKEFMSSFLLGILI